MFCPNCGHRIKRTMLKDLMPKVEKMARSGMLYKDIAEKLGFDKYYVYRYCNERGIPIHLERRMKKNERT
jgi:hypothetical protein